MNFTNLMSPESLILSFVGDEGISMKKRIDFKGILKRIIL